MTMSKEMNLSPEQIESEKAYESMGLSDAEYKRAKEIMKRQPNLTETGIFSVMWSEHCSYKTSKPLLSKFPTKAPHVLIGPGEGAGVVDINDDQAVVFKIESHNHPSTVDPFEGAATGVGGILRDVFSMGARPIAVMNSLRFGRLGTDRTNYLFKEVVRGIANYGNKVGVPTVGGDIQFDDHYEHNPLVNAMAVGLINHSDIQKGIAAGVGNTVIYAGAPTGREGIQIGTDRTNYLFKEVVRGIANYGNKVGVPTVGGDIQFDDHYEHNPLVNAMAVGLINHSDIQKGIAAGVGNTVIYAGAPTGRDGIHGATHSSDDQESAEASPAPGNPLLEKRIIAACLEVIHSDA